jgi:hypothetical protein
MKTLIIPQKGFFVTVNIYNTAQKIVDTELTLIKNKNNNHGTNKGKINQ